MTDLTEYGEVMLDGIDEWGFRKIDGLLEDGRIIIVVSAVVAKSFTESGLGFDAFVNPYRAMGFSEAGSGSESFGIPFKAMPFSDAGHGAEAFNTPFKTMGFSDIGLGSDAFTTPQAQPPAPFGGGFPFWWEKAEAWAPSLFQLFRKERAYIQAQVQLARKETVSFPATFKVAKPERNEIKGQPFLAIRKGEVESKREIKAKTVLAKKEKRVIQAPPFKTAEPSMTIVPAEFKMMTYPELLQTVEAVKRKKHRKI